MHMEKEKKRNDQSKTEVRGENQALDPLFCELAVAMNEELRHIQFISTQKLRKLHTCHNVQELSKYFETEQKILSAIFEKNPDLKNQSPFEAYIELVPENGYIFDLIQYYTSIDYIRHFSEK